MFCERVKKNPLEYFSDALVCSHRGVDVFTSFCRGIFVPAALAGVKCLLSQPAIVSQVVVVRYAQQQMGKNCCLAAPDTQVT